MSGKVSGTVGAGMKGAAEILDYDRAVFLTRLEEASRAGELGLTDWELGFLRSFRVCQKYYLWMTDGRRKKCDSLWHRFGGRLGMAMPDK